MLLNQEDHSQILKLLPNKNFPQESGFRQSI
jgi:hypothetical protein